MYLHTRQLLINVFWERRMTHFFTFHLSPRWTESDQSVKMVRFLDIIADTSLISSENSSSGSGGKSYPLLMSFAQQKLLSGLVSFSKITFTQRFSSLQHSQLLNKWFFSSRFTTRSLKKLHVYVDHVFVDACTYLRLDLIESSFHFCNLACNNAISIMHSTSYH